MKKDQSRTPLFNALKKYHDKGVTPFDVPGHKHGKGLGELADFLGQKVLEVDVNSMKPLDNLNKPTGVIKEAEELAAEAYSADNACFLVNGTTSSVQGMVMTVLKPGDKIILPRNVHKSVINALILSGGIPVYIQPEVNEKLGIAMGVSYESVEKSIKENSDAKAILIINPTYYGATSDIEKISKLAHNHDIAVLVDEAHGAHFAFHPQLPASSISVGADIVAVSSHKTGGSLTQSSMILSNNEMIKPEEIRTAVELTQTTSASYLLMTSLDISRKNLAINGEKLLQKTLELSRYAREEINKLEPFYAFGKELIDGNGVYDFDETKLGVNVSEIGLTGFEVYDLLRDEYNIQVELGDVNNILAIVSIGDDKESIDKLINALNDISKTYKGTKIEIDKTPILENPELVLAPRDAYYTAKQEIPWSESEGLVSGEFVMAYPPGIPIIIPGEKITKHMIDYVEILKRQKTLIQGPEDDNIKFIKVLDI